MEIHESNGGGGGGGGVLLWWEFTVVFLLRPFLAVLFVLSIILFSWLVAWKTVLVHVPLVQEICGLKKKTVKPKPPTRHRLSRFYNSNPSLRNSRSGKEENFEKLSSEISTSG